jgi:hypothetical protein
VGVSGHGPLKTVIQHSPAEITKNVTADVASSKDQITYTTAKKPVNVDLTSSVSKSEFSIVNICDSKFTLIFQNFTNTDKK